MTKTEKEVPRPTQGGGLLNRYFHYADRGGTLGGEISAGLLLGILSVCGMFLNMQLVAKLQVSGDYAASSAAQVAANGEIYASLYFISMLLAFLGSMVIGLVARLPLVQRSSLSFSTVLISLAGTASGLTYSNLLVICFFSSILYALLVSIPGVWKGFVAAIPAPVRRALPAASGVLLAWVAVQLTGAISVNPSDISVYGAGAVFENVSDQVALPGLIDFGNFTYTADRYHPLMLISTAAVFVTLVAWLLLKKRSRHPYLYSLLLGTALFLILNICLVCINWNNMGMSLDTMWGRLWMVGSEDALHHHLGRILSSFSIGTIFSEGLDFSAYTANGGNVALLFLTGLLTFLLTSLLDGQATLSAVTDAAEDAGSSRAALICNAGMGIAATVLGAAPLSIGKESVAGKEDGGRSGLTSVVASLVFLVSMFVWVIPFFFATAMSYDITFTIYGHFGAAIQIMTECSFAVVNLVMAIVGLSMAARCLQAGWGNFTEAVSLVVTVAGAFFLSSLVCGVALGSIAYVLTAAGRKTEGIPLTVPVIVWGVISLALLVLISIG